MSVDIERLNSSLGSFKSQTNFSAVEQASNELKTSADALYKSKLGKQTGQTISGIETVSEEITAVVPVVDGKLKDVYVGQTIGQFPVQMSTIASTGLDGLTGTTGISLSGVIGVVTAIASGNLLSGVSALALSALGSLALSTTGTASQAQDTDDFNELTSGKSIALITSSHPLASTIKSNKGVSNIGSSASDLAKITEEPVVDAFNFEIFSGPGPKAVAESLNVVAKIPPTTTLPTVQPLTKSDLAQTLPSALPLQSNQLMGQYTSKISSFTQAVTSIVAGGLTGILKNVIENQFREVTNEIGKITNVSSLPPTTLNQVINTVESGNLVSASEQLSPYTTLPQQQVDTILSGVNTTLAGKVGTPSKSTISPNAVAPTSINFSYIDSYEELIAEFRGSQREITEVVVHWTAHFINQLNVGAEEIHRFHTQERGFSSIGYHYIIKRNGALQRGRPIDLEGSHARDNGHNRYSIGVAFVAGYNCLSGTPNPNQYVSAESITADQFNTFYSFMKAFYEVWPGNQAWGHSDTDNQGKIDPGFSVPDYVLNAFNKRNVSLSGTTPPLSRSQLLASRAGV